MPDEILEMLQQDGNTVIDPEEDKGTGGNGNGNDPEKNTDPDLEIKSDDDPDKGKEPDNDDPDKGKKAEEDPDPAEGDDPEKFDFHSEFDGYENLDQVKQMAERGKQFDEKAEQELTELRGQKENFEKYQNYNPYKNEKYYKLEKLAESEEDKEHIDVYQKYLLGEPDDLEVIKMGMLLKNGKFFKNNPEALDRKIQRKYPALFDGTEQDEEAYKDAFDDMQLDAQDVRNEFDKKLNGIQIPEAKDLAKEQEETNKKFIESWKPEIAKLKEEGFKTLPLTIPDAKDPSKEIKLMDFPISDKEADNLVVIAANHIVERGLKPTPENVAAAKKAALGEYLSNNLPKIIETIVKQTDEEGGAKWRSLVSNPKKVTGKHSVPESKNTKTSESSQKEAVDQINEGFL